MTSMPEMVASIQRLRWHGSLAGGLGGTHRKLDTFTLVTIILSILIGGLTFTGSLIAYGKLVETHSARSCPSAASRWSTA